MQRVVIEYTERTYTPPPVGDFARAATITATVTSATGPEAATIGRSGLLVDLRETLEDAQFDHDGTQPVQLHQRGRYQPLWREVWTKEEETMNTWSLRAQKNHEQGRARARARAARLKREEDTMRAGPHLDGHTLIVPSCWYQVEAAAFWKAHGFRFDRDNRRWTRDTRRPHEGKRYSAQAWLESTRREFYKFWPKLEEETKGEES